MFFSYWKNKKTKIGKNVESMNNAIKPIPN